MRAIDKPDHLPALGAPCNRKPPLGDPDATRRRLFESGDHQPDGLVLPASYKDDLKASGCRTYTMEMIPNDSSELPAVRKGCLGTGKFYDENGEPWPNEINPAPRSLMMTMEVSKEEAERLCGIDPAAVGSDRTVVIMKGRQNGLTEAVQKAMHDNMRFGVGPAARMVYDRMTDEEILALPESVSPSPVTMSPADDTPHEEVRNLLDDIMVDAGELSFAAADVLRHMIRAAMIDACEHAPALQRNMQTSMLSWRMASNVMLRLLGCAPGPRGRVVDETAPDAYYPARLQDLRLIIDPTDEVPRHDEELRPQRDRQPAQDDGAARRGGGLVLALEPTVRCDVDDLTSWLHDRPGSEARSGHALRAAETADGCLQRQGREAGGVAPAVGSAEWLRSEEGEKYLRLLVSLSDEQRRNFNIEVGRRLIRQNQERL